jgi:hypothetical protein
MTDDDDTFALAVLVKPPDDPELTRDERTGAMMAFSMMSVADKVLDHFNEGDADRRDMITAMALGGCLIAAATRRKKISIHAILGVIELALRHGWVTKDELSALPRDKPN